MDYISLVHRMEQRAERALKEAGATLTSTQIKVLADIAEHPGTSQTGIVDRTAIDRSTLADVIRRMVRLGLLIRRRPREDARAYDVRLTDAGSAALRANERAHALAERILTAAFPVLLRAKPPAVTDKRERVRA